MHGSAESGRNATSSGDRPGGSARTTTPAADGLHILEWRQPYRDSLIWELQRRYFAQRGADAWRFGEVPHYITSNPAAANAYAEIVFAFRRDLERLSPGGTGPLTICELGAGSGRFAFHFLRRLSQLCEEAGAAPAAAFRYVLTDMVEANLQFWRSHPSFAAFFATGLLDVARFDLVRPGDLELQLAGTTIAAGDLHHPLVVIANYVLDGVPQDLLRFENGRVRDTLISLAVEAGADAVDDDPEGLDPAELFTRLRISHSDAPSGPPAYPEPELQALLEEYREALHSTYLLFPAQALRGLQRLADLSRHGLLLLSADKGEHRLEALDDRDPPALICHGGISLSVNYHAFARICEAAGGRALLPGGPCRNIAVVALLMVPGADRFAATRRAYREQVGDFGPDDFYTLINHVWQTVEQMSAAAILASLRLCHHDSQHFLCCLPRLLSLAEELGEEAREEIREAVDRVWAMHFPLGEEADLAHGIAALLYAIDDYAGALAFYDRSIAIYGRDTGTLFNMACCHHLLDRPAEAAATLRDVLQHDPGNLPARELLDQCEAAI